MANGCPGCSNRLLVKAFFVQLLSIATLMFLFGDRLIYSSSYPSWFIHKNKRTFSLRPPTTPRPTPSPSLPPTPPAKFHIIFSTDCSDFQIWQSQVLLYTARSVGENNPITQIVSGCKNNQEIAKYQSLISEKKNFFVHFTPNFFPIDGDDWPIFNKPLGIRHWLINTTRPIRERVIVMLDPDQLFFKPFQFYGQFNPKSMRYTGKHSPSSMTDNVTDGWGVGQRYGIGTKWTRYDLKKITGEDFPKSGSVSLEDAREYYKVGAPIFLTKNDWMKVSEKWCQYNPPTRKRDKDWMADMYAYAIATSQLGIKHKIFNHHQVSDFREDAGDESWAAIDEWLMSHDACDDEGSPTFLPTLLHYCQTYQVERHVNWWHFNKRLVPKKIMECDFPLLKVPPKDYVKAGTESKKIRRSAWMMCQCIKRINKAILEWKKDNCIGYINSKKLADAFRCHDWAPCNPKPKDFTGYDGDVSWHGIQGLDEEKKDNE